MTLWKRSLHFLHWLHGRRPNSIISGVSLMEGGRARLRPRPPWWWTSVGSWGIQLVSLNTTSGPTCPWLQDVWCLNQGGRHSGRVWGLDEGSGQWSGGRTPQRHTRLVVEWCLDWTITQTQNLIMGCNGLHTEPNYDVYSTTPRP